MEVVVDKGELSDALKRVSHGVDDSDKMLAFKTIAFQVKEGRILLTATNRTMSVQAEVATENADVEMAFGVKGDVVSGLVQSLSGDTVKLRVKDDKVHITSGKFRSKLNLIDPDVLPKTLYFNTDKFSGLTLSKFLSKLNRASVCCSQADETSYVKTVYVNKSHFVATDRFRIATCDNDVISMEGGEQLFIPAVAAKKIHKIFNGVEGMAKIAFDSAELIINVGGVFAVIRQMATNYPNYEALFQGVEDSQVSWQVSTRYITETLKRLSVVAGKKYHSYLTLEGKQLKVQATSDYGSAEDTLDVVLPKGSVEAVPFNSLYLLDALAQIDSGMVTFQLCSMGENRYRLFIIDGDYRYVALSIDTVRRGD
jgi:DNA polymerase III beta subunit